MSSNPDTAAPTGRMKRVQGTKRGDDALGHDPQNRATPEDWKNSENREPNFETGGGLLARIVTERRDWFDRQQAKAKTKKKYIEPVGPETGNLPALPEGWVWGTWNQLSNWVTYGFTRPMPHVEKGIPIITAKGVNRGRIVFEEADLTTRDAYEKLSEKDRPQPGDILITKDGTIGRAAVVDGDHEFCINQSVAVIWLRSCPMERQFLLAVIESELTQKPIWAKARGVAIQHLSITDFAKMAVPIPPLPEQRRIVAEIEKQFTRLEAGVAALQRVQANLKRYRAAVLNAACEGRLVPTEAALARSPRSTKNGPLAYETGEALLARILTERRQNWQGRGQYKQPAAPVTTNLQPLPEGWAWATAEQLTDENRSITYGVIKLGAPVPDGVHVLRSSDVRHLRLDLEDVKRVSPDIAGEYRRTFLKGGEVLITVRGTLGGVVVAPAECAGFNISREVAMLAMVQPAVAKIAAIFIGSAPLQRWLLQRAKGIAYTGINIETLKELPIPLPPLAEQTRIVAEVERRLSVVEELESVVTANLQRATRLRQSILQKAFTGNL